MRELTTEQIESLIRHAEDPEGRVIPQLRGFIAWLVAMHPAVRALVLSLEPDLMLDSDLASESQELRAAVVDAILIASDTGALRTPDWGRWRRYDRLAHSNLAAQLRPTVTDAARAEPTRRLAMEIATSAKASGLDNDAVGIASSPREPLALRVEAVRYVASVGNSAARRALVPLAVEPQDDDLNDDLKGAALEAVWPEHLSPSDLFDALSPPKRSNRSGDYDVFMLHLAESLSPEACVAGLQWARSLQGGRFGARRRVADALVMASWNFLDRQDVLGALAEFAIARMRQYEGLVEYDLDREFAAKVSGNPTLRRNLTAAIVERLGADRALITLARGNEREILVGGEDVDWLLGKVLESEPGDLVGAGWAMLLRFTIDMNDPESFPTLFKHRHEPHIQKEFGSWWSPIALDSPYANELRDHFRRMEELERQREQHRSADAPPPSRERVAEILDGPASAQSADAADPAAAWIDAAWELTRQENGRFQSDQLIDRGPTWALLLPSERERILEAAAHFLRSRAALVTSWTEHGKMTWGAWAGDRAMRLLESAGGNRMDELPKEVWESWSRVILRRRPPLSDADALELHLRLTRRIYVIDPSATLDSLLAILLEEDESYGGHLMSLGIVEQLWDDSVGRAVLTWSGEPRFSTSAYGALLRLALKHDVAGAYEEAGTSFGPPLPRGGRRRDRAIAAAAALLSATAGGAWSVVRDAVRRSQKFATETALAVAQLPVDLQRFPEADLGEMFEWLTARFPYPDPEYEGVYSPSPADQARSLRGDVIMALRERATPEAVDVLQGLSRSFPNLPWLGQVVLRAREAFRRKTWTPPTARQLIELAAGTDCRLVESREHLAKLLTDSLSRFESELHGELPAVSGLWDQVTATEYKPKDEQELSDAIARHFRRDLVDRGVVAGREVVIRRGGAGGVPGQRTDIYVNAIRPDATPISAIVEVKGAWNEEVLTSLQDQLVGDYLERNPECDLGVYVVGWYLCQRWLDKPRRRKTARHGSMAELSAILYTQADRESSPQRLVRSIVLDASWP